MLVNVSQLATELGLTVSATRRLAENGVFTPIYLGTTRALYDVDASKTALAAISTVPAVSNAPAFSQEYWANKAAESRAARAASIQARRAQGLPVGRPAKSK